jgi:hypothetical protein
MSQSLEANRSSIAAEEQVVGTTSAAAAESESPSSTSFPTKEDQVMMERKIPNLYEYWKAPTVDDKDINNFHMPRCLPRDALCSPTSLEFPTIDHTSIVCFVSHLICSLDLPPSEFLVAILNYLGCKLIHLHPNAIGALICFSMVCECWQDIPLDTSLF